MRRLLLACALLLAACTTNVYKLDARWAPLTELREASWVADGMVTTLGGVGYVSGLDRYLEQYPPDTLHFNALMTHERVHATQERDLGGQFYVDYAAFPSKRWEFESAAWSAEFRYYADHGARPTLADCQWYAAMASERYRGMIGYDQALRWFTQEAAR